MMEMLPGFYNYMIINSVAALEAPHSDPSSSSWRTSHPCRQGASEWSVEVKKPPLSHTPTVLPHLNIIQL